MSLRDDLIAKNLLADQQTYDLRTKIVASGLATSLARATTRPGLFMVVPTLRCDHDCRYCQVSRAPLDATGYELSAGYAEKIVEFIGHIGGDNIKIEFQGGEPLVAFEFIKKLVDIAEVELADRSLSIVICSALGPLDDDILEWSKERNVVFSVSLDGDHSVHSRNRPSKYFDSFENTIKGIARIQASLGRDRVSCLSTVTRRSLHQPERLVDTYFDLGLDSIFIRPLSPFGFASKSQHKLGYTANEYAAFYRHCLEHVIRLNDKRTFVEESALIRLRRIFDPGYSSYVDLQSPAGYVLGAIVFNYDGQIFGSDEARMLWQSTRADGLSLGVVGDDPAQVIQNGSAAALLSDTFLCSVPGCEECALQPFCGADPLHHLSSQGDHVGDKSISFFCKLQRALFDQLFELISLEPRASDTFDRWLNR